MRKVLLAIYSVLIFTIPFVFTRATEQIFEFNKFTFLLSFSGIITILFAFYLIREKEIAVPILSKAQKITLMLFGFFLLSLIISTIFSASPPESFFGSYFRSQGLLLFFNVFLLSAIAVFLRITKQELIYFLVLPLICAGTIESIIAIFQDIFADKYFTDLDLERYHNREIGTFGQPNLLGRFLLFPFFTCLLFLFNKTNKYKLLIILPLMLISLGLFVTGSRGAFVGLFLGFLFYLIYYFISNKKFKFLIISFVSLIFLSITFIFINNNEFAKRSDAIDMRLLTWQQTPKAIIEKPIFGWGIEQQENAYAKIADRKLVESSAGGVLDRAHNEILDFLIQIGIFGTLAYLTFLSFAFYLGIKKLEKNPYFIGIFAAIFGSFCARQFGFFSVTENLYFFLFLGIIIFQSTNGSQKISSNIYQKVIAFVLIITGIFTFYFARNIWQADKLYFEKQTKESYEKTSWNKIYAKKYIQELLYTEDFEKAEEILKKLQKKYPAWHETYYLWSQFYAFQNQKEETIESLNKAIELFPKKIIYQEIQKRLQDDKI